MEAEKAELSLHLETLKQALKTLEELFQESYSVIVRDAAIQRFEYTFELAWKLLRRVAKLEGIDIVSPRQAIRTAHDLGLLTDVDDWFEFLENRNLTSHTYNRQTADQVFESAKKFPSKLSVAVKNIEERYLP